MTQLDKPVAQVGAAPAMTSASDGEWPEPRLQTPATSAPALFLAVARHCSRSPSAVTCVAPIVSSLRPGEAPTCALATWQQHYRGSSPLVCRP